MTVKPYAIGTAIISAAWYFLDAAYTRDIRECPEE